jgi:hypothetical protein
MSTLSGLISAGGGGGISVPIGGTLNLLHTAETVTQGEETFFTNWSHINCFDVPERSNQELHCICNSPRAIDDNASTAFSLAR